MTNARKRVLRRKVLAFASQILHLTSDQAEMPDPKNDEEDEWMRSELQNIASDLAAEACEP